MRSMVADQFKGSSHIILNQGAHNLQSQGLCLPDIEIRRQSGPIVIEIKLVSLRCFLDIQPDEPLLAPIEAMLNGIQDNFIDNKGQVARRLPGRLWRHRA